MTEAVQPVLVTQNRKGGEQKRTTDSKGIQLMGIQGIIKELCICIWRGGGGGVSELH